MSDADAFARFIKEMPALVGSIEAQCGLAARAETGERRLTALRDIARLARAVEALALAFDVEDLASLGHLLAESAAAAEIGEAGAGSDDVLALTPPGWRDTIEYIQWRVKRFAQTGHLELPTARDLIHIEWLKRTLRARPGTYPDQADDAELAALPDLFADMSELTLTERALVRSFPASPVRKRDPRADARLLERMATAPAFITQSESGAGVPVFGVADDDLAEMEPGLRRKFVSDSQADMRELGRLILDYERRPGDRKTLNDLELVAHKIKGTASIMAFPGVSTIAGRLLEVIRAGQRHFAAPHAEIVAGLGRFMGLIEQALAAAALLEEPEPALIEEAKRLHDTLMRADAAHPTLHAPPEAATAEDAATERREEAPEQAGHREQAPRIDGYRLDMLMNQLSALAANRGAVTRNRREVAQTLDEMRAALERLREKSAQIADAHPLTFDAFAGVAAGAPTARAGATQRATLDDALASQTPTGALRASWSNLQLEQFSEMDTALRGMAEVVSDLTANYGSLSGLLNQLSQLTEAQETLSRDIQDDAMSIRLARLAEIIPQLRIAAMVAASDAGKQVEFEVRGEDIEIDRLLLEELQQPLSQLILNALAHGIETPDQRAETGKPPRGRVWIDVRTVGSDVIIEVGDDGRGVNPHLLVGAAIGAELISSEEARDLSQEQALSFMFYQGVTTIRKDEAGEDHAMAGAGVGLADVARIIHQLRGEISLRSERGKGTVFQVRVPVSLSTAPVLEVGAEGQVFALPFAMVEYSAMVEPGLLREVEPERRQERGGLREWRLALAPQPPAAAAEATLPTVADASEMRAYALAETLGFAQDASALRRVVVIQMQGQQVGLLVESVGEGDVRVATVRPLPPRLRRRVVRGAIVRPEDGQVALLIDPMEALARRISGAQIMLRPAQSRPEPRVAAPSVLIVDDSVTIRRSVEQTLMQAGFKTRLARDGMEALERMEEELPRVVILDVEMPRLSGFELLAIMRNSPQYAQTRVVMLTSRAADKHRDYALAIGADDYLVKPCSQEMLVETIRRLLTESEPQ
ncbi:MAG TPA: response regulator [Ktedonobacterales bacterium]|nr:response regulator [Ktedonobacterales bacterium]